VPSCWEVRDLQALKELLAERYAWIRTLRDSGELVVSDVVDGLSNTTQFILVLDEDERSWGNRNRNYIEAAARKRGIDIRIVPPMPIEAVIALHT
jgi:hypothetical protein